MYVAPWQRRYRNAHLYTGSSNVPNHPDPPPEQKNFITE
jgi:hypothetical protein